MLTYQGETMSIYDWARRLGTVDTTIRARMAAGWSIEDALSTRVKHRDVRPGGNAFLMACNGLLSAEEYLAMTEAEEYDRPA